MRHLNDIRLQSVAIRCEKLLTRLSFGISQKEDVSLSSGYTEHQRRIVGIMTGVFFIFREKYVKHKSVNLKTVPLYGSYIRLFALFYIVFENLYYLCVVVSIFFGVYGSEKFGGMEIEIKALHAVKERVSVEYHFLSYTYVITVGMGKYPRRNLSVADMSLYVICFGVFATVNNYSSVFRCYYYKSHSKGTKFR